MAAHYYSYSFCLNPDWTRKYPLQPEILDYLKRVAAKYDIEKHARFHSIVNSAHWDESSRTWLVTVTDLKASKTYNRRCKILVSAVGILSLPNGCDIDGASSFKGPLFHTAQWDHSFDWKDKDLVVIGWFCCIYRYMVISNEQKETDAVQLRSSRLSVTPTMAPAPPGKSPSSLVRRNGSLSGPTHRIRAGSDGR